jgi:hypothetical protein
VTTEAETIEAAWKAWQVTVRRLDWSEREPRKSFEAGYRACQAATEARIRELELALANADQELEAAPMTNPKLPRVGRDAATLRYVAKSLRRRAAKLYELAPKCGMNDLGIRHTIDKGMTLEAIADRFTREARAATRAAKGK